ncbi:MAG: ISAs1 family transposase [Actinobacteria bacterium]|nr:ISAs1 family transposase [Actinomycetota bacterium]
MPTFPSLSLTDHFAALDDPRVDRTKLHPLLSIIVIAICAVITGAESWDDIEEFGEIRADWFASFLDLPHGIASHDTFNRVFAALDPEQFQACFLAWMQAVAGVLPAQVIAIDGKTVRRSHDRDSSKAAIHMVSAWASANRLVLAQVKVDEKSNEITALPDLLRCLVLTGCVVTIDAMGCQRQIAQQILDQGGTYVLALKKNQDTLHDEVQLSFATAQADDFAGIQHDTVETIEKGHGRIETRQAWVIDDPAVLAWLQERHAWPGLQAIGMVRGKRRIGNEHTVEDRYYLLAAPLSACAFGDAVRSHWGIENQVHYVLDVAFREDQSRIRVGYAAENFAVLRHIALNLLRQQTVKRKSIKGRRLKAAWDTDFLLQVLTSS